jgi:hypothetical protein
MSYVPCTYLRNENHNILTLQWEHNNVLSTLNTERDWGGDIRHATCTICSVLPSAWYYHQNNISQIYTQCDNGVNAAMQNVF